MTKYKTRKMKTFNEYLSNMFDELDVDLDNDMWGQYTDIEQQQPLSTEFRQLSVDKIFRRKNKPVNNDILGPIKEYEDEHEDKVKEEETTKVYRENIVIYKNSTFNNNFNNNSKMMNYHFIVTGLCSFMLIKLVLKF